jgi:mannose-6-phosphate isomerase-like protein (cupin superfamily)
MFVNRKDQVDSPLVSSTGEEVYELIGMGERLGGSNHHSFAYVVIPPGCSSRPHYHNEREETYFILKGRGRLQINHERRLVKPGDAIFIPPKNRHRIITVGRKALEFVTVCAPAWILDDNIFQEIQGEKG